MCFSNSGFGGFGGLHPPRVRLCSPYAIKMVKSRKVSRVCNTRGRDENYVQNLVAKPQEEGPFGHLYARIYGKKILQLTLGNSVLRCESNPSAPVYGPLVDSYKHYNEIKLSYRPTDAQLKPFLL